MDPHDKQLVEVAGKIRDGILAMQISRHAWVGTQLSHVTDRLESLGRIRRKLTVCRARGWQMAAIRLSRKLDGALRDLPHYAGAAQQAVEAARHQVVPLRDIYEELRQTEAEFGEVRYDAGEDLLAVTIDPIELEGLYLGDFEVQLHLSWLGESHHGIAYTVEALDPRPAASNNAVTHPHVSDDRLCEGDAGAAIQAALASGRICDFFTLVRSVLHTYNPHSPYVSLDDWYGTPCYECGCSVTGDDVYTCANCERDFCGDCSTYCRCCVRPVFPKLAA